MRSLKNIAKTLSNAFGPFAASTSIKTSPSEQNRFGVTIYTKDGHTILQNILLNLPIEQSVREDLISITRETVKKVGDGTTSAVILSSLIFEWLVQANLKYSVPERVLVDDLCSVTNEVIERIEKNGHPATLDDIYKIALISTHYNYKIANAIYEIYKKHGMNVHIDIGISNTENHIMREYDGMSFDQGYYHESFINDAASASSIIDKPRIYIFEDPIDTREMRVLFDRIYYDNIIAPTQQMDYIRQHPEDKKAKLENPRLIPTVVFSPGYGTDMKSMADELFERFSQSPPEMRPPFLSVTNIHDAPALKDLAILTGARMIKKYNDPEVERMDQEEGRAPTVNSVSTSFYGTADRVVATASNTKVINPTNMYAWEDNGEHAVDENGNWEYSIVYKNLVKMLEQHIAELEEGKTELTEIYLTKKRLHRIQGDLVEYLVGGIAIADRDYYRDLTEDAVLNCRSAAENGVGYGANFEALRVLNEIAKERNVPNPNNSYTMEGILLDVYSKIAMMLYGTACDDLDIVKKIITESLQRGKPCNIFQMTFGGEKVEEDGQTKWKPYLPDEELKKGFAEKNAVLSSIKSDPVILNAISRIIGVVFNTNQYLTSSIEENRYTDDDKIPKA